MWEIPKKRHKKDNLVSSIVLILSFLLVGCGVNAGYGKGGFEDKGQLEENEQTVLTEDISSDGVEYDLDAMGQKQNFDYQSGYQRSSRGPKYSTDPVQRKAEQAVLGMIVQQEDYIDALDKADKIQGSLAKKSEIIKKAFGQPKENSDKSYTALRAKLKDEIVIVANETETLFNAESHSLLLYDKLFNKFIERVKKSMPDLEGDIINQRDASWKTWAMLDCLQTVYEYKEKTLWGRYTTTKNEEVANWIERDCIEKCFGNICKRLFKEQMRQIHAELKSKFNIPSGDGHTKDMYQQAGDERGSIQKSTREIGIGGQTIVSQFIKEQQGYIYAIDQASMVHGTIEKKIGIIQEAFGRAEETSFNSYTKIKAVMDDLVAVVVDENDKVFNSKQNGLFLYDKLCKKFIDNVVILNKETTSDQISNTIKIYEQNVRNRMRDKRVPVQNLDDHNLEDPLDNEPDAPWKTWAMLDCLQAVYEYKQKTFWYRYNNQKDWPVGAWIERKSMEKYCDALCALLLKRRIVESHIKIVTDLGGKWPPSFKRFQGRYKFSDL